MKGFLTAHDRLFRKTHDLDELGRACEALTPTLTSLLGEARDLTVFAWAFRYPGDAVVPPLDEARQALETARKVYESLVVILPSDVRL